MSENRRRVLEMLSDDKVSIEEDRRLIGGVDEDAASVGAPQETLMEREGPARYSTVVVDSNSSSEHVDVRVPPALFKAGVKLHWLVPGRAAEEISTALKDQGIDAHVSHLRAEDIEIWSTPPAISKSKSRAVATMSAYTASNRATHLP